MNRKKRSRTAPARSNNYQTLEPRQMLASIGFDNGEVIVRGNAGNDVIELVGSSDFQSFTVRINSDANLTETFQYSEVTSLLVFAGGGDDRVTNTLLRDSLINGGAGNDFLEGGFRDDILVGGTGNDTLVGRVGGDTLRGQGGVDRIFGGPGQDRLFGADGNDTLVGGTGNDLLRGDAGNDVLRGQDGADRLFGGEDADRLFGEAGNDRLVGQNGNDILVGGFGNDRLEGNAGDDLLNGNEGNDTIFAGLGDDTANGGRGDDSIFGIDGANTLGGNGGDDTINGGNGADTIRGGSGNDRLAGGAGDDRIRGGDGDDEIFGGSGDDNLAGNDGADLLAGQDGDDELFGSLFAPEGSSQNRLLGNAGDDGFVAVSSADFLNGGEGVDQFSAAATSRFEFQVDRVGAGFQLTDIRIPSESAFFDQITLFSVEQIEAFQEDAVPIASLLTRPITQRIIVQPIVVSDDDGSNTAISFGNAEQEAEIRRRVNRIYNQAGVEVEFLPTRQYNSTFANGVGEGIRPLGDFSEIIARGDAAGIGSSDPLVVDYYFVNRVPGLEAPIVSSNGRAFVGRTGAVQAVSDVAPDFLVGRSFIARALAHEVGHNLGLEHSTTPSLLDTMGSTGFLTPTQIQRILASDITQPV